jgi:VWFA-related protein
MTLGTRFAALFSGTLLLTVVLAAQQNGPPAAAKTSRISLDVVVSAKSGPPVGGLQQGDFTLLDNKTPRPMTSFKAVSEGQEPIHIILVLDAVNTPYERVAYARDHMNTFLRANGGHLAQPTSIAIFTDQGTQLGEGFTTDGNQLSAALDKAAPGLRTIRRSSQWAASDQLHLSLTALGELVAAEAKIPGRKAIFWVSPGWPLLSGPHVILDGKQTDQIFSNIVGLSTEMREARITLYGVDPLGAAEGVGRTFYYEDFLKGVSKTSQVALGDLSLQVLSIQSGGFALSSSNDIVALLQKCMTDAGAYYEVSFDSPPADRRNEYHSLEIRVDKPGLIARTRQGYYAQP